MRHPSGAETIAFYTSMIRIISRVINRPEWLTRAGRFRPKLGAGMGTLQLVRILLVGTSNMLSNIVTAALAQARDFVVVGNIGEQEDLSSQIRQTRADAVIIHARQPGTADTFVPLLRSFPALTIVAIGPTGSGFVHQLRLHSIHMAELSADALQAVLRAEPG